MEFEIDYPTVRATFADEYRQARAEIASLGAIAACRKSAQRHDARLATAPDVSTLACRSGCSWCCYFSVDVRPIEVFVILDFVERELRERDRERIRRELAINRGLLASLSEHERAQRNVKCPFLAEGRCSIYSVRPQTCRNYHATDAAGCRKSFEEPENLDIDPEFAPLTYQIGGSHVEAFSEAMSEAGYDVSAYELNAAFASALEDTHAARARFESKQKTFADLVGTDASSEFVELAQFDRSQSE
jgi:Fe-S-cluster containining protein